MQMGREKDCMEDSKPYSEFVGANDHSAPNFPQRNERPIFIRFLAGIGEREENELAREGDRL